MNIFKYLLPCIVVFFFLVTGVYADDNDNKKYYDKDEKKYHKKKWDKKGKSKGSFAMIEARGKLFLYNKRTGEVWVCNAFKKICEQVIVENKDTN